MSKFCRNISYYDVNGKSKQSNVDFFFQIETVKFINAGLISSESAEAEK